MDHPPVNKKNISPEDKKAGSSSGVWLLPYGYYKAHYPRNPTSFVIRRTSSLFSITIIG